MKPTWLLRDDVQRAARVIPGKRLQVERLGDHSLAREGRIAVYENCQGGGRIVPGIGCRVIGLSGAREPLDDRVDGLEMARVRRQHDAHLAARRVAVPLGAEVILDVPRPLFRVVRHRVDHPLALELAQDLVVRPTDRVREHVEAAAVSHPDHDLFGARRGRQLDRLVEHRHIASSPSIENCFCPMKVRRR